jgi:ketosteroid isomerase-like protein
VAIGGILAGVDHVEIVRRAFAAAFRPDPDWVALAEFYAADHVMVTRTDAVDGGEWIGAAGYRDWLRSTEEGIEWHSTIGEVTEIDADRVLALVPTTIRGRQSDLDLGEHQLAALVTLRDGKLVRTDMFASIDDARAAAGVARPDSG